MPRKWSCQEPFDVHRHLALGVTCDTVPLALPGAGLVPGAMDLCRLHTSHTFFVSMGYLLVMVYSTCLKLGF